MPAAALLFPAVFVTRAEAAVDEPRWRLFTARPPLDGTSVDTRRTGCFPLTRTASMQAGCQLDLRPAVAAAAPHPWDDLGDPPPTYTSTGNAADTRLSPESPFTPGADPVRPTSPTRDYVSPWTNAWRSSRCNPANFAGGIASAQGPSVFGATDANDVNASILSLFATHNRLHDWSYGWGFTPATGNMEGADPIIGAVQADAPAQSPTFAARDAVHHVTPADGVSPTHTMHLWRPVASRWYGPCVDGAFDVSLVAHTYAHAIVDRMAQKRPTSAPDGQARALVEGIADLLAVEYLQQQAAGDTGDQDRFAIGAYVSGSSARGVRNYSMAASPLNFSNVGGYDRSGGQSPHDDGEIWSAVGHDIRSAIGAQEWTRLLFRSLPKLGAGATLLDARDALLAADTETAGTWRSSLWTAFARRGLGQGASTAGTDDPQPRPDFRSPERADESTLTLNATGADGAPVAAQLFVGDYAAGTTPVADTDPGTSQGPSVDLVPGRYRFVVAAAGHGMHRIEREIAAGSATALDVVLPRNRAAVANGATVTGDGQDAALLLDDSEATGWTASGRTPDVAGTRVTVDLAGGAQVVEQVAISALVQSDDDSPDRFTALRAFELQTCLASAANDNCAAPDAFAGAPLYVSAADAFPGDAPRPVAPQLNLRTFDVADTMATHLRLVARTNQCSGYGPFNDPTLTTDPNRGSDCTAGNGSQAARTDQTVRAAELQVFSRDLPANVEIRDPVIEQTGSAVAQTGPAVAQTGLTVAQTGPTVAQTDLTAPVFANVGMTRTRFAAGAKLPRIAAVGTGTAVRFTLSEPAQVTLAFARRQAGRRVGGRCVAARRALRRRPACRRYGAAGRILLAGRAGAQRVRFEGRLTRSRTLRPGSYRLLLTAVDAAGNRSATTALAFTLLRRVGR